MEANLLVKWGGICCRFLSVPPFKKNTTIGQSPRLMTNQHGGALASSPKPPRMFWEHIPSQLWTATISRMLLGNPQAMNLSDPVHPTSHF
ncbi:C-x8-C-x5-C-x3-H zinc finger protein [Histoplasma capsulatum var. duboisii H88]|uniref:C-x8-C-x5-C-x3-H zinc finger protein n=1 Tax=Ajellomyces capsulatus (strain H88) TaxID=544711 RepID=A0A8A1LDK6_AJEC8|nr:C-x8-C-x5-C-x3-H zinc finger protein [Histoplasma capsulatum var. duboisii H88]